MSHLENILDLPGVALIGAVGAVNVVELLTYLHDNFDTEDALVRGRFAVRTVAAMQLPADADAYKVAALTGFFHARSRDFFEVLTATGKSAGEMSAERLRDYLIGTIIEGTHPRTLADQMGVSSDEYHTLYHLLEIEEHWRDTLTERVILAVKAGEDLRRIAQVAGCGRLQALKLRAYARRFLASSDPDGSS